MNKKRHAPKSKATVQPEPAANDADVFFTVDELALRWRCHRQTVTAAIRARQLQAFKPGRGHYRISEAEVHRYEREHMASAVAS